jgi:hypothetical protein
MSEPKKKGRPRKGEVRVKPERIPKPKGRKGPRPHVWIVGPDEYKHQMYTPWQKMKAQANFRGEEFDLDFEPFYNMWNGYWHQRGRKGDDLVMTRIDWEKAWHKDNIVLITRTEQCQRQGMYKRMKKGIF